MQDERLAQNSNDRFPFIEMPEDRVQNQPTKGNRFEITTDEVENRKKAIFEFDIKTQFDLNTEVPKSVEGTVADTADIKIAKQRSIDLAALVTNAEKLIQHGEIDLAKGLIYRALALNSNHPAALRLAEKVLHPVRDLEKITKIRENLCKVDYRFETVALLAEAYYKSGQDQKAKELYFQSISLVVDENELLFEVYKNLGNILTREGDYDGAEEFYHRAFALNPDSDVLLVNLGTLELQQNEYNEALDRFRKAIQVNKQNDKAWVGLALVHNQMGDRNLAVANIENAIDLNSQNRTAVHIYANWAVQEGKFVQAIETLQTFLSQHESDEEMSLVLIQLLCQVNRFDLAKLEMERVLLWNPKSEKMQQIEIELSKLAKGIK